MLYGLKFIPNHPIYKLQEAVEFFFETGLNQKKFGDACFPDWFLPVLSECSSLKQKFRKVFREVSRQDLATRNLLLRTWQSHGQIRELCGNLKLTVEHWNNVQEKVNIVITDLFTTLYDETLNRVSFQRAVGTTFEKHYRAFRELGQRVCPFCGMHEYKDRGSNSRASYDHYLPRTHYPLAAVNFKNLVPICDECNEAPNKGALDLLFSDKKRTKRRICYYPYDDLGGIFIDISSLKRAQLGEPGKWKVTAEPVVKKEEQSVRTWKTVFNIERRYVNRLSESCDIWVKNFLNSRSYAAPPSLATLREDFRKKSAWLSEPEQLRLIADSALQAAYFQFLATRASADQLAGFVGLSTSGAIVQGPISARKKS